MQELPRVDGDLDEDVEHRHRGGIDGDEAAVAEVDEQVHVERASGQVVDAARAVGDVAEDEAVRDGGEGGEDVGDDERVHQEALRELERDARGVRGAHAPDDLVDLEVVVRRQQGDGGVERRVVEDGVGDLAPHKTLRPRFGRWRRLRLLNQLVVVVVGGGGGGGGFRHRRGEKVTVLKNTLGCV